MCLVFSEELCELLFWRRLLRPFYYRLRCGEVREPEGVVGLRPQFRQSVISDQKRPFVTDFESCSVGSLTDNASIVREDVPHWVETFSTSAWVYSLSRQLIFRSSFDIRRPVKEFFPLRED